MNDSVFLAVPNHRNPEQRDAFLAAYFQKYIDCLLGRLKPEIPTLPEEFRVPIAEVDRDLKAGFFERHFTVSGNQISAKTDGAEMVLVMAAAYRKEFGKDL